MLVFDQEGKDSLIALFDLTKRFVLMSGGDGDGWIVSHKYRELADLFEAHESDKWFISKYEGNGMITFSHNQESITLDRKSVV